MTCDACGATARVGAAWCGQCHRPFGADSGHETSGYRRHVPPETVSRPEVHSRWRKSPTSFGPVGRILWTVGVLLVAGLCWFSADPFAIGGWCLIGAPLVLRSVWAKARIA
jgi:hypothetical protein